MRAKKSFRLLATRQFPDNTHLSVCFETEVEMAVKDQAGLRKLHELAYNSTYADVNQRSEDDPAVQAVFKNLHRQFKLEKKRENAE